MVSDGLRALARDLAMHTAKESELLIPAAIFSKEQNPARRATGHIHVPKEKVSTTTSTNVSNAQAMFRMETYQGRIMRLPASSADKAYFIPAPPAKWRR